MIDRAEDGGIPADAVLRGTELSDADPGDAGPRETVLADPARRVVIHRLYRDLVDYTYGRTRGAQAEGAWAEAVPELWAAWEKHEEKYPERSRPTPRSQPDGAWEADGNRRLAPEQNAEATRACADIRKEGKEVILPAMERVEAADPTRRLAGLDHMLKGEDRLKEKSSS